MTKPLPKDIEATVYDIAKLGRDAKANGDLVLAESKFIEAWNQLPKPREQWDMSQILSYDIIDFYLSTKQYAKAENWLPMLALAYESENDGTVLMVAGIVYYESKKYDLAYQKFNNLYKEDKARPFQGHNKKYLDFYLKQSKAHLEGKTEFLDSVHEEEESSSNESDDVIYGENMELPDSLYEKITLLSDEGNDAMDNEDFEKANSVFEQALDLLPEPKTQWEAYTWLCASKADAFFQLKDFENAASCAFDALNGPDAMVNPFIHLRLGQSLFELNRMERATSELLQAYMLHGLDIFTDEDLKYLNFLKSKVELEEPEKKPWWKFW